MAPSNVSSSNVSFSDLKVGRFSGNVVGRLLRHWEARNVKKGGELMGVDFLLLDEKSTMIQGSISVHRLNTFKHLLKEGSTYTMSGFDVTRSNPNFKLCDSAVSICFTELTTFVPIAESDHNIPTEMFSFRNHSQLMALANTNSVLPDIIGEVRMIRTTQNEDTQTTERVMVHIKIDKESTVCVSVFDTLANLLHQKLETSGVEHKVLIATNVNPKFVGGRLFLNATSGTHFYFDKETAASKAFYQELLQIAEGDSTTVSKYRGVQKIETVTLADLNAYILSSTPQEIEFLCTGKVNEINTKNGWCYISCSKCSRKLQRGFSTLTCNACHDSNAVGVLKYRVEMSVSDGKDEAQFVGFDSEMTKLTNVRAADANNLMGFGDHGLDSNNPPQILKDIVGRTYTFHLKLSEYKFSAKHQSFTISRIFDGRQRLPRPTFNVHGGGGDDMPGDNMPGIAIPKYTDSDSTNLIDVPPTHPGDTPQAELAPTLITTNATTSSGSDAAVETLEPATKKARKNKELMK